MTPTRSRNRIFIIFQNFFIVIPILTKIDFLTVLESDIYDSDSSIKRIITPLTDIFRSSEVGGHAERDFRLINRSIGEEIH